MDTNIYIMHEPESKSGLFADKSIRLNLNRISGLIFIIFLLLTNQFTACTNADSSFYNKVLNDFDTTSYFIAVDIKSPYYKGRTIIENNNLYRYLHLTKGFDKEKYIYFMKRTLRHHRAIKTTDKDVITWNFIKVTELESVIHVANSGRDNFVAKYFNGTTLIFGLTSEEQNSIINQLFYWEIPAKIDKQTKELMIG